MGKYQQGYQDAACIDWASLPVDYAKKLIADYEARAIKNKNTYLLGFANGAEDILSRSVAA